MSHKTMQVKAPSELIEDIESLLKRADIAPEVEYNIEDISEGVDSQSKAPIGLDEVVSVLKVISIVFNTAKAYLDFRKKLDEVRKSKGKDIEIKEDV